jgi:hypothetical protein
MCGVVLCICKKEKGQNMFEVFGYIAIFLTVIGQVAVNIDPLYGQAAWMVANVLFLVKAVKQKQGKAEITRNVVMSAITAGLIGLCVLGVF